MRFLQTSNALEQRSEVRAKFQRHRVLRSPEKRSTPPRGKVSPPPQESPQGSIATAVLISGRGSNLEALAKSMHPSNPLNIEMVVSNNPEAKGLDVAKQFNIPTEVRLEEEEILEVISGMKLVCLAGFMDILSGGFIEKAPPMINIHPSLLPDYKGLNTHARAIENGEEKAGCTVHRVTEELDSGEILDQKEVSIEKGWDAEELAKRVLAEEHKLYPKVAQKVAAEIALG